MALILAATAIALFLAAFGLNWDRVRRLDGAGEPDRGIVVFIEPVRWLFVVWGFTWFCRGLRQAGGGHRVHLFRWSSAAGALLVIPDLVRRRRLDRKAKRLANYLDRLSCVHPGATIHVVGYSTGAYVAAEACKQLRWPEPIRSLVLLAPSFSPSYDWGGLADRNISVHSFHSPLDMINVVGPGLFGGNDRKWGPAGGAVGFDCEPDVVAQRRWRISDIALGYWGGHFTVAAPRFVARQVAPLLA